MNRSSPRPAALLTGLLTGLLTLLPAAVQAAPASYTVTPASGKYDHAMGLNNAGFFAVNNADTNVPYRIGYLSNGLVQEGVGTLGGGDSIIAGFSNRNEAVGNATTAEGGPHAFLYSSGRMHDLTARYGIGVATAINDRGDIGGQTASTAANGQALLLHDGKVQVFDRPDSTVADVNNAGDVVGNYLSAGQRIFRYTQAGLSDVGIPSSAGAQAAGLNDAGALVGTRYATDGHSYAFLDVAGRITDLTPPAVSSTAYGINNLGEVVGTTGNRAFLYTDGQLIDLNTLVDPNAHVLLTSAIAINDRGQILANACDAQGVFCYATLRLDPVPAVPEAPGAAMLLAGLAGLALRARACASRFRNAGSARPSRAG